MTSSFTPVGVIPACLLPFNTDLSIDFDNFRKHLSQVASVAGVSALTINAHSTEVASCSYAEQEQVLLAAREHLPDTPLINGIYADGSLEAAQIAKMAERHGASALLVFPPDVFNMSHDDEMVLTHFRRIADASDLPIILFQYSRQSAQHYSLPLLMKVCDEIPSIRAIKDWTGDPQEHARNVALLQGRSRPVNVLTTHSAWLLSSLVLGCNGLLSGSGSVIADLHAQLFQHVKANDLDGARAIHERIRPLADAFYSAPWSNMHNRMKEALVLLGRLPRAVVRPPLTKISAKEIESIRQALISSGFLAGQTQSTAA